MPPVEGFGVFSLPGDNAPSRPPSKPLGEILLEEQDHSSHIDLDCSIEPSVLSEGLLLHKPSLFLGCLETDFCSSFSIYCMSLGAYRFCDGYRTSPESLPLLILQARSSAQCMDTVTCYGRLLSIHDSGATHLNLYSLHVCTRVASLILTNIRAPVDGFLYFRVLICSCRHNTTSAFAITSTPLQSHPGRLWHL